MALYMPFFYYICTPIIHKNILYLVRKLINAIPTGVLSAIATALCLYLLLDNDPFGAQHVHLFPGSDKVAHILMFMGVACAYIYDYAKYRLPHHTNTNKELAFATAAFTVGILAEVAQLVMQNGRSFEWADLLADAMGAILGFLFMKFYFIKRFRNYVLKFKRHHHHHQHKD